MGNISLVIPYRDNRATIGRTLDSLQAQVLGGRRLEVIVVEDHSTDFVESEITGHPLAKIWPVRVIANDRGGLAHGYNLGWRAAQYDFVVFMHADCYLPDRGALLRLVESFVNERVVAVQSINALPVSDWRGMSFWDQVATARYVGRVSHDFCGKFDAVRRSALEALGGFDEEHFFSAGEDLDFTIRLRKIGELVSSGVWVIHAHRYPQKAPVLGIFRKQAQLGQGFGALVRKHWRYVFDRELLEHVLTHLVKAGLVFGLLVPVLSPWCFGLLFLMACMYSWRAFGLRDWRVVLIPFVNIGQFVVFIGYALIGLGSGKQTFRY